MGLLNMLQIYTYIECIHVRENPAEITHHKISVVSCIHKMVTVRRDGD